MRPPSPLYYEGRLRTRQIDWKGSPARRVWAHACGQSFCDDATFDSRQVGWVNGRRLFAGVSECFVSEDPEDPVEFVLQDANPPWGVSDRLYLHIHDGVDADPKLTQCFGGDACPDALLVWDGSSSWTGSIFLVGGAEITIELTWDEINEKWVLTFGGCAGTGSGGDQVFYSDTTAPVTCTWPWRMEGQGLVLGSSCCPELLANSDGLPFVLYSYTKNRKVARQVGRVNSKRVFAYADCCAQSDCNIEDCCECPLSPFEWALSVSGVSEGGAGVCACFNGDWVLTLNDASGGECAWDSEPYVSPCVSGPTNGMWHLRCRTATRDYLLSTQNGLAAANYVLSFDDWDCLGPNTLVFSSSSGLCNNWPGTLTVTPV